ncbi:NUDIX hydrolase domain-like protein [Irpex rosettiformis]|uniref:NUDIX hydrolase domain-like protein n=1 Tax=Irpex rosettiformis TaxID=378272 RepID=A0ACB8TTA4_9APHY|nr:NUDIX hydrolase domain-like protein [Irpex rosettiformis]
MTITSVLPVIAPKVSEQALQHIERLLKHRPEAVESLDRTKARQAAVLVLLYEKPEGELRVLLTTRAKTLRTHPGQTALPGGRMDESDESIVETAYREAFEEVGLPLNHPGVHTLCLLRPFIAWTRSLVLVTPVVSFLTDFSVLENLRPCESEVDIIFDHPLEAILEPSLSASEPLVPLNSELWPSDIEYYNYADSKWSWMGGSTYRLHRFRAAAAAIKGLTADVLILTASIAYDRQPSFEWFAPGQFTTLQDTLAVLNLSAFNKWNNNAETSASANVKPVSIE